MCKIKDEVIGGTFPITRTIPKDKSFKPVIIEILPQGWSKDITESIIWGSNK